MNARDDHIMATAAFHAVIASTADDQIAAAAIKLIVAIKTENQITAVAAGDQVVT